MSSTAEAAPGPPREAAACEACLRRGYLLGRLTGRIAGLLDRPGRRTPGLLALPDDRLVEAAAGDEAPAVWKFLEAFDASEARESLAAAGVAASCRHSDAYPARLRELSDAPAVLFTLGSKGGLGLLGEPSVALVGARRASPYGREVAHALGRGLAASGVGVVSGLALGIDAEAHRGCLAGGGAPVAVLACGPDVAYPRTNRRLYERVVETGVVVSELPPGQRPFRWSFPARNRIMAGLTDMTVVVEAADPSGSLITTEFAADLHRTVGAVPGQVTAASAAGTNRLLRDGAVVVRGTEDILDELYGAGGEVPRPPARRVAAEPADPVERRLLEAVEHGLGIDGVCSHAGLPVHEARAALSRLEARGRVRRDALGGYQRAAER